MQLRGAAFRSAAAFLLLASPACGTVQTPAVRRIELSEEVTSFLVVGEWGGSATPPYTTPTQLAVAAGMAAVAAPTVSAFVLSPGGNFLDDGVQGAQNNTPAGAATAAQSLAGWSPAAAARRARCLAPC